MRNEERAKDKYLRSKIRLLKEFGIIADSDIISEISNLYPDDIAVEQYHRKLILEKLNRR